MDDRIAILLCLPFILAPLVTLILIVANRLQTSCPGTNLQRR